MITAADIQRFLRGELTDPIAAAEILLAADRDPALSLWLDLFVPTTSEEPEPVPASRPTPTSPDRPRT